MGKWEKLLDIKNSLGDIFAVIETVNGDIFCVTDNEKYHGDEVFSDDFVELRLLRSVKSKAGVVFLIVELPKTKALVTIRKTVALVNLKLSYKEGK